MDGPRSSPDQRARRAARPEEDLPTGDDLEEAPSAPPGGTGPEGSRAPGLPRGDDLRPSARALAEAKRRTEEERWEETERILRDIDGLRDEVRSKKAPPETSTPVLPTPPADETVPAVATPPPPEPAPEPILAPPPPVPTPIREPTEPALDFPSPPDLWESPNSYLEERLRLADATAEELGRDVRAIAAAWDRVTQNIGTLEEEVRNAHDEMDFIRSSARAWESLEAGRPLPGPAAPALVPARASPPARAPAATGADRAAALPLASAPQYAAFTADRYNRTIGALKSRRRRLAGWTLVTAGAISLALVTITALANDAMPPLWLAVLPAVWMIPVPFFVLSFRGTQRVLRHNHLDVPGGSP